MPGKMFSGSISLTELIDKAKAGHSAFVKASNGKIYVNIVIWENEEPDKFDNVMSLQLSSKKENRDSEGKVYIGNAKPFEKVEAKPLTKKDTEFIDDLPF